MIRTASTPRSLTRDDRNNLPKRDRVVVLSSLGAVTIFSWAYLWGLAHDPMAMCMVNMHPWTPGDLIALFGMWVVMMIAMMLPSASPMIVRFRHACVTASCRSC